MKVDEVVKALRWIASNDEICFNAEQANVAADLLERLQAKLEAITKDRDQWKVAAEASRDAIQPKLRAEIEGLKAENERLKADYNLIDDFERSQSGKLLEENRKLKESQPVRCGEVASHSEKEIVEGCITLMQRLANKFKEYLEFVNFEPECEEERFCVGFHYSEIVKTLLLAGTSHSGGTSTAKKCKELGFNYSIAVEFDFEEDAE